MAIFHISIYNLKLVLSIFSGNKLILHYFLLILCIFACHVGGEQVYHQHFSYFGKISHKSLVFYIFTLNDSDCGLFMVVVVNGIRGEFWRQIFLNLHTAISQGRLLWSPAHFMVDIIYNLAEKDLENIIREEIYKGSL